MSEFNNHLGTSIMVSAQLEFIQFNALELLPQKRKSFNIKCKCQGRAHNTVELVKN